MNELSEARTAGVDFFSRCEMWRFRQMSAAGLSVRVTKRDGLLIDPAGMGSELTHVGKPEGWTFGDPPDARKDPRHEDFSRCKNASLNLPDEASVSEMLRRVHEERKSLGLPREWQPSEADAHAIAREPFSERHQLMVDGPEIAKFTVQKGSIGHWFITKQGGAPDPPALTDELFGQVLAHVIDVYVKAMPARKNWVSKPPPAETNSGFPFFGKHPALKLASTLITAPDLKTMQDRGVEMCNLLAIDPKLNFCLGVAARSGPLAKEVDILRFTGNHWAHRGKGRGFRQRERVVMMASPSVNWQLEGLFCGLHEARKNIPGLWHAGDADRQLASRFEYSYECDIASYDTSVSRGLQLCWIDAMREGKSQFTPLELDSYLWSETLPLVTPHWGLDDSLVTAVTFRGATRSGLKHTAEAGTLMAVTASLYALAEQGFDYTEWPRARSYALLHQGDDALVCVDRTLSREGWAESYAKVGFRAALLGSDVFLSKHQRSLRASAPRVGRLIQQTGANEREKTGPEDLAIGLQIIGFLGRCEGVEGLQPRCREAVWRALQPIYWIRVALKHLGRCHDLVAFRDSLRKHPWSVAAQLTSLKWRDSDSWFTKTLRDADHSPAARAIIDHAESMGLDTATLTALDKRVWAAAHALNAESWAQRREYLGEVALARGDGIKALDAVFAKWTNRYVGVVETPSSPTDRPTSQNGKEED